MKPVNGRDYSWPPSTSQQSLTHLEPNAVFFLLRILRHVRPYFWLFRETARLWYPYMCKSQRSLGFTLHASLCRSARSWAHPSALAPPRVAWRTRARRKWTPSGATAVSRPGKRTEPLPVSQVHGAGRECDKIVLFWLSSRLRTLLVTI